MESEDVKLSPPGSPCVIPWGVNSSDAVRFPLMPRSTLTQASIHNILPPPGTESLSFDLHESRQYVDHITGLGKRERKLKGGIRWVLLFMTGILSGLIGVTVDMGVNSFFRTRFALLRHLASHTGNLVLQYVVFVSIAMALASVAGYLVCFVEPLAAGSGIPEVKCYLNGVDLPRLVDFRTLIAKAPGVMFSVAAGLPCGKEGPMIHSGAIVGSLLARLGNGPLLRPYRSDVESRDMVVAGAASGVASAFGAPLGGVLFALEEGASHMNPAILVRTFFCSMTAALTVRFFLGPLNDKTAWGSMGSAAPMSFGHFEWNHNDTYRIWELPIFALIGVGGGLCGALFNAANTQLTHFRMRWIGGRGPKRFMEVLVVSFTIASLFFLIPTLTGTSTLTTDYDQFDQEEIMFWKPGGAVITSLFHSTTDFSAMLLLCYVSLYYVLACWTYGLGVPSGLFVPSLVTGAVLGRLFGQAMARTGMQTVSPGVYSLVGATAFLAGMARITISLAVILIEATGSTVFALPIFLTVMASKWTGDFFTHGLYDIHIHLKNVPLLETFPEKDMIVMRAGDVMHTEVLVVERAEFVRDILKMLEGCNHHAFPVIHPTSKRYVGMVKRSTLHEILYYGKDWGVFQHPSNDLLSPAPMIPYDVVIRRYPNTPSLKEIRAVLTPECDMRRVDLGPYTNRGGYTVPVHAALTRVYMLFRTMGLRHLPVISHNGDVCGIITRKDLIFAHVSEMDDHTSIVAPGTQPNEPNYAMRLRRHFLLVAQPGSVSQSSTVGSDGAAEHTTAMVSEDWGKDEAGKDVGQASEGLERSQ